MLNSILLVFYMFRTSYVHHQEDYIVRVWCVFHAFMQGCMYNIVFLMMNIRCSKHVEDIFSLLYCVCCRVTQLLHQPLHIYKIYNILHIKTLKTLLHVSVLRPSSGSYIFLAKVTLEIVTY